MRLITGKLDNRRAIIDVGLQPSTSFIDGVSPVSHSLRIDLPPLRGLLDTGAQITCVTKRTARDFGLVPRGKRLLGNVSNFEKHTSYSFVLGVWYADPGGDTLNEARGYYAFDPVLGCDFKDNESFDVLIGMDIISRGDFSAKRDGSFTWELP